MANGAEVARAYITIIPSMEGSQQSLTEQLTGASSNAGKTAGQTAGSSFSSTLMTGIKTAGVAVGAITTGAVMAGTKLFDLASGVAKTGDNIDKMSQKIGISTDAYQEWGYVFERCGANVDNLQGGMKTLSSVITDASNGSASATAKLEALGLSVEQLSGLSQEQQLSLVISALQGMEEGAERTSVATDLLGRSATDMAGVLNMSAEETRGLINEAHAYGMVMSEDAVKSSASFQDSLTKLQGTVGGLKNSMVGQLLPGITQIMDGLSDLVVGADGAGEAIQTGAMSVIDTINGLIPQLSTLLVTIGSAIMQSAPGILQALADGLIQSLPILIPAVVSMITEITSTMITLLPQLVEASFQIITALATGIAEAIPTMIPQIVEVVTSIVQTLVEHAPELIVSAYEIMLALANGIIDAIPTLLDSLPTLITSFCNGINNLPKIIEMGLKLIASLTKGIIQAIPQLLTSVPQILNSLRNGFNGIMGQIGQIGINIVKGIWNGISSAGSWLWNQITGWANNILGGIRKAFGIHSPSKYTAEMGQMLDIGLAEGMTDNLDVVESATDDLNSAVMNNLSGVTSTIGASASVDASVFDNRGSSDLALIISAISRVQTAIENKSLTIDGRRISETVTKFQRQTARALG